MIKWMAEFELETIAAIPPNISIIPQTNPTNSYSFKIINKDLPEEGPATLIIRIFFNSEDIKSAEEQAEEILEQILSRFSLVYSLPITILGPTVLVDWSDDKTMRDFFIYSKYNTEDYDGFLIPEPLEAFDILYNDEYAFELEQCLSWFRSGIQARNLSHQFQCFWFVIETLSVVNSDRSKTQDKCVRCRGNLVCSSCGEPSMHKPFPKQLIRQSLIDMGVDQPLVDDLFKVRNMLMHGDSRQTIEDFFRQKEQPNFELEQIVNILAKISKQATFAKLATIKNNCELSLLEPDSYAHKRMKAKAHIQSVVPKGSYGLMDDKIPRPTINIIKSPRNSTENK